LPSKKDEDDYDEMIIKFENKTKKQKSDQNPNKIE
jgi:hypothetical protein